MRGTIVTLTVLGLTTLAAACNDGSGPTAIEIPIDRVELVAFCSSLVEMETCTFRAEAFSGEQMVANPVLRWSAAPATVATIEESSSTSALVRARQSGQADIIVSNSTGTVTDRKTLHVFAASPK